MSGIFLLVATLGLFSGTEAALSLDLYYESLCPDSTRFISQQIGPMHAALGQDVTINFVPYGFATVTREFIDSVRDPTFLFQCQPLVISDKRLFTQKKLNVYSVKPVSPDSILAGFNLFSSFTALKFDVVTFCIEGGVIHTETRKSCPPNQ